MRLPVVPSVDTKDGISNKNARMTNMLRDKDKAVVRPGLSTVTGFTPSSGTGNGLYAFGNDDAYIDISGSTLYLASESNVQGSAAMSVDLSVVTGSGTVLTPASGAGTYRGNFYAGSALEAEYVPPDYLYGYLPNYGYLDTHVGIGSYAGFVSGGAVAGLYTAYIGGTYLSALTLFGTTWSASDLTSVKVGNTTLLGANASFAPLLVLQSEDPDVYVTVGEGWAWAASTLVPATGVYQATIVMAA